MLLSATAGCADEGEAYCAALEEQQSRLAEATEAAQSEGGIDLPAIVGAFTVLREAAPDDLVDEWDILLGAYATLADEVEAAGVPSERYRPGVRPDEVSREEARQIAALSAELASGRVRDAAGVVERQADEVCGVTFGA